MNNKREDLNSVLSGIGLDIIELDRIRKQIDNEQFIQRILVQSEREVYQELSAKRKTEFLAGRFSAKEAYVKAKGTGIGKSLSFQDIEVLNTPLGKPQLSDRTAVPGQQVHLSITHTRQTAAAVVIIESLSC